MHHKKVLKHYPDMAPSTTVLLLVALAWVGAAGGDRGGGGPPTTVHVEDYGAIGDAKTLNTDAFAAAFNASRALGGGAVVVGPGVFLSGPIAFTASHQALVLGPDAAPGMPRTWLAVPAAVLGLGAAAFAGVVYGRAVERTRLLGAP